MVLNFFIIYSFHTCIQCDFWSLSFQITFSQPLHIPTESFLLPNKFLLLFTCFYFYDLGSLHEHGALNWSMDHYITEENDSSSSSSQWLFKDWWDFISLLLVIMGCWWPLSTCEFLGTTTVSCLKAMSCGSPCSYILSTQPPMMFSSKQKFCLLLDVHTSSFVKYLSIHLLPSPHFGKAVLTFYVLELFYVLWEKFSVRYMIGSYFHSFHSGISFQVVSWGRYEAQLVCFRLCTDLCPLLHTI